MTSNWQESEHPRDEDGKFTYKNNSSYSLNIESYKGKMQRRSEILYPTMKTKEPNINYKNTGFVSSISYNKNKKLKDYVIGSYNDYKSLQNPANTVFYSLGSFATNYIELKDANTKGADKYFHARANYDAAQQGLVGSLTAKIISDIREYSDSYRNINEKGYSKEYSDKDIEEDQQANEEGRILGRLNPIAPAYSKLQHLMPNGFPDRYRHR